MSHSGRRQDRFSTFLITRICGRTLNCSAPTLQTVKLGAIFSSLEINAISLWDKKLSFKPNNFLFTLHNICRNRFRQKHELARSIFKFFWHTHCAFRLSTKGEKRDEILLSDTNR